MKTAADAKQAIAALKGKTGLCEAERGYERGFLHRMRAKRTPRL